MPESKPRSVLEQAVADFGAAITRYGDNVVASMRQADRPDDAEVATGLRDALAVQAETLSDQVGRLMASFSSEDRKMLDTRAQQSGLVSLAASAKSYAGGSTLARIGIVELIEPIKKILRQLLDLINISLPDWVSKILDFINNIIEVISGLLGARERSRAETTQRAMYRHLRDLYATDAAQLHFARAGRWQETDTEE
jgi:hypothetical protein